jgi:lysophospholipase L1-like esterase
MTKMDFLFFGDSITEFWQYEGRNTWERFFKNRSCNLGVSGDTTIDTLFLLKREKSKERIPKVVMLLIGANDLLRGGNVSEIIENIKKIIIKLKSLFPNAVHVLHGLLPVSNYPDSYRSKGHEINVLLKNIAKKENMKFLLIDQIFIKEDNSIPTSLMPDGVHLTSIAYKRWGELLLPFLESLSN